MILFIMILGLRKAGVSRASGGSGIKTMEVGISVLFHDGRAAFMIALGLNGHRQIKYDQPPYS